jgi:hypothetical protein
MKTIDKLRKLMYQTVSELRELGLTEEDATDQVIGIIQTNSANIDDVDYMTTMCKGLVDINRKDSL